MTQKRELPWQVFQLASSLLPYLDRAFEEVSLSPTDLFVLSHLKHFGTNDQAGRKVMLKNEIRSLLTKVYGYSEPRATSIIKELHNKGLVEFKDLTEKEKEKIFGVGDGYKSVVILQTNGVAELDLFNSKINGLFTELTADFGERKYKGFVLAMTLFASHAGKRLQKMRTQKTFQAIGSAR